MSGYSRARSGGLSRFEMTLDEASRRNGVTVQQLLAAIRQGQLRARKERFRLWVTRASVTAYLARATEAGDGEGSLRARRPAASGGESLAGGVQPWTWRMRISE